MNADILDPCCGTKMFYFDRHDRRVLFGDSRRNTFCVPDRSTKEEHRIIRIAPDFVCDVTHLDSIEDNVFSLVIFDPPHLLHAGENSWMAKKYGVLPADWISFFRDAFRELFRVLAHKGTLVFKWSEKDIRAKDVLSCTDQAPVIGSMSRIRGTKWFIFFKE